jgi:hypothetical protein
VWYHTKHGWFLLLALASATTPPTLTLTLLMCVVPCPTHMIAALSQHQTHHSISTFTAPAVQAPRSSPPMRQLPVTG